MIFMSASGLKDYFYCKKMLWYRVNKPPKELPKKTTASMILGGVGHDLIDHYHTSGGGGLLELYTEKLNKRLSAPGVEFYRGQTWANLSTHLEKCWHNYHRLEPLLPGLLQSEVPFSFNFSPDAKVLGRFDQHRKNNTLVELKTSKNPPDELFLASDIQATLYIWAYTELFHVVPTYLYVHLLSGSVYKVKRSGQELNLLIDHLREMLDDMKYNKLVRQNDGYRCGKCDYREHCFERTGDSSLVLDVSHNTRPRPRRSQGNYATP